MALVQLCGSDFLASGKGCKPRTQSHEFLTVGSVHLKQQEKLLADIASAVKNQEMPLSQYTLIHRNAKLSDADRNILYGWARVERRNLKSKCPLCPLALIGQRVAADVQSFFPVEIAKKIRSREYFIWSIGIAQ